MGRGFKGSSWSTATGTAGGGEEEKGLGGPLPGSPQGKRGPLGGGNFPPPLMFLPSSTMFEAIS